MNAYDHLLEETVTDPSTLRLHDSKQTQLSEVPNTTLLYNSNDKRDEVTDGDILELDVPLPVENYFCDIPS